MKNNQVVELMKSRKSGHVDKRKLGLFLIGGGMRGAFSGGVMVALEELGFSDVFDVIYGFSSGAFSGAYLLSHKAELGTSIYYEDLSGNRFIQPWRLFRTMNLDYFCEQIVRKEKNLDQDKIKKSKTIFKIFVTEVNSGERKSLTNKDGIDLITALRASCSFPGYSYPYVDINEKLFVDGSMENLIPIEEAIRDGCTDILFISTIPLENMVAGFSSTDILSSIIAPGLGQKSRGHLRARALKCKHNYYKYLAEGSVCGANILLISPMYAISPAESRKIVLEKYALHGTDRALKCLS